MGLALSLSWNASRHESAGTMLSEIRDAGFREVELSFNLTGRIVGEVEEIVRAGGVKVVSVHNFCPIPGGLKRSDALPDYYSMASTVEDERRRAVSHTKHSIDTAHRLNAAAVVLHCGRVAVSDRTPQLVSLYERGLRSGDEYRALYDDMVRERKELARPFFEQTLKSLDELNEYARGRGVLLGVETRYYHREIPSFEEMGGIFRRFAGSNIRYWHDTGHAQVMDRLGFCPHKDFLEAYGGVMAGTHMHNVTGCRDHKAPLKGDLDFAVLVPYLKPAMLKVIEAHAPATADDLRESKKLLEKLFDECS